MIDRLRRTINAKNLVKVIVAGAIVSLLVMSRSTSADAVMTGTVKDNGGNGISGATVCIAPVQGQNCTQTDTSGVFVLSIVSGFNYMDIYGNGGSLLSPEGNWSAGHYTATIQDTDTLAFTLKTQVASSLITDQLGSTIENARAQITSDTYQSPQSSLDSSVSLTYYGGSNSLSTGYTDSNGQVVLHVLDNATAITGVAYPPVGSLFQPGPLAPPRNDDPISNPYSGGISLKGVLYYPGITGLTANPFNTPNAPSLTWTAVQGADHYNIYRKFNVTTDLVNAGTNTNLHLAGDMVGSSGINSFVDNQATAEGVYIYQVSAIDSNGSILAFTDNSGQGEVGLIVDRTDPVLSSPTFSISPVTANTTTTLSVNATDPFQASISSSGVARVEYFIGNDPGVGQATPFLTNTIFDSTTATYTYSTDVNMPSAGTYPVTIRAIDNAGNYSTQIVNLVVNPSPIPQLTALNPAKIWVGLKNSDDVGVKFDLKAEVYKDSTLVTSGEVDSVAAGSSGFNNAKLDTVNFNSFSPVDFPSGSQLKLKLYVRNACSGSGHNSGTARLWFNDASATSQFGATIATNSSNYYVLDNSLLGTSAGSGPKKTVDVAAGAKCSAFKPFGTWSIAP